jgi:hypothetical protein
MKYVSGIDLEVNGQVISDFQKFKETKVERRKAVNLMRKTGYVEVTARYAFDLDYVIPADDERFDFTDVVDGTVTIDMGGGKRRTYTGVFFMSEGDVTYEDGKESMQTMEFGATGRVDQ